MTAILCVAALLGAPASPCERGGHATIPPMRGGHAITITLEPIGDERAWLCIHRHEAAWNDTGDPYWGGLQMDRNFMAAYGRDMTLRHHGGLADTWTPREQMVVAERAHKVRGYGPWPNTRIPCGV